MRLLTFIFIVTLPLFSDFFPKPQESIISKVSKNKITLTPPITTKGMSGIIIHNYGKGIEAITSKFIQKTAKKALLIESKIIPHKKLPQINTAVKVGDKVISGYLYENVLLLAPNAQVYSKIIAQYPKKWIHPDLFGLYLGIEGESIPTKENLRHFAEKNQIGLIYIVRQNDEVLFDPLSGQIIAKQPLSFNAKTSKSPFYMRFESLDNSWFFKNEKISYYKIVESL